MASASKRQQWQAHVDDALLRTGQVQRAAIFGLDGKEWATSSGFQVRSFENTVPIRNLGILLRSAPLVYIPVLHRLIAFSLTGP